MPQNLFVSPARAMPDSFQATVGFLSSLRIIGSRQRSPVRADDLAVSLKAASASFDPGRIMSLGLSPDCQGNTDNQTHGVCYAFSYGVNSTNIRIVSTFKPSSRIAVCPS
jgi:hypothetical protein